VIQSISRVRGDVTDKDHVKAARRVLALLSIYQDIEDLVNIGAYVPGVNLEFDLAVQMRPKIVQYLQQEPQSPSNLEQSKKQLQELYALVERTELTLKTAQSKRPGQGNAR
jgi:flagellum-specific ATP synthase